MGDPPGGMGGVDSVEAVEITVFEERVREIERVAEELEADKVVAVRVCTAVLDVVEEAPAVTRTVEVLEAVGDEDENEERMVEVMVAAVLVGSS